METQNINLRLPLPKLLERPLIVGASISANYKTASPGRVLSLKYTSPSEILTIARSGTPGVEVLKSVTQSALNDRSIVLALDLFFWDSFAPSANAVTASVESLERFVQTVGGSGIPWILGNIPELLPGMQPARDQLNQVIGQAASNVAKGFVFDLDSIYREILQAGGIEFQTRRYGVRELVPDGIHLSAVGSEYLAIRLEEALARSRTF